MASNSSGTIFRITTWGESHGIAIGVIIDGCPAGIEFSEEELWLDMKRRSPGQNPHISSRNEKDEPQILSGIFEGKTTGTPISIIIYNTDSRPQSYEPIAHLLRPGHANYTYLAKYGIFDYRGGGRASARETACRVAAGSLAKKFLQHSSIKCHAYLKQLDTIVAKELSCLEQRTLSPVHCPDPEASDQMILLLSQIQKEGNSCGGIVEFVVEGMPTGIGDPVYEKLEANLAKALLSIPASKGFEIGSGFSSASMKGSLHNDLYLKREGKIETQSNFSGGVLGGISTGMPLVGRVAFKPTSSIFKPQETLTVTGERTEFTLPEGSRHDPCVAIRAVPIVEGMVALVIADALLLHRCSCL